MRGQRQGFFEQPHAATYFLIALNVALFAMTALTTNHQTYDEKKNRPCIENS